MRIRGVKSINKFNFLKTKKIDLFFLITLFILVIFSRIIFKSHYLYDVDSTNFALAFQDYNIALHQPHPPGYILFVATGKIINYFFNDPNNSMIFLSIFLSILTIVLIYFLSEQIFSRQFAIIASVLLAFNPIFWFYGEIASVYMNVAFFATLIAYSSYQLLKGDNRFLYISSIILGLSGGFRPDLVIFMFPLWFFCLIYQNKDYKRITKALVLLVLSVLIWIVPTIILAGGYENYLLLNKYQFFTSFSTTSMLFGSTVMNNLNNYLNLIFYSIWGFGIISFVILGIFISFHIRSIFKFSFLKDVRCLFLLLWIIPSFMFYLLIFIAKPGYILVYIPAFVIIMAYVIINFSMDLNSRFNISKNHFMIFILFLSILSNVVLFIYPLSIGMDYGTIRTADTNYQYLIQTIERFDPNNTIIFTDLEDWRKDMYYFPNYESYSYIHTGKNEFLHYKNHKFENTPSLNINSSSSTKILWIINENSDFFKDFGYKIKIKSIELPNGQQVNYSDVVNL